MCGFVGYYAPQNFAADLINKMGDAISYRGPDAAGYLREQSVGLHICHRRLSVIDLSEAGAQPMKSYTGRYDIIYNGEIYNYLQIRDELEKGGNAYQWRGHSDTEIILQAFEIWGIEATLQKMVGMFAIALWDKQTKKLFLCRDRMGEKPMYYGWQEQTFFFGSELKAFLPHPAFGKNINPTAVSSFFKYNYVPGDSCIYEGIKKLKAGFFAEIDFQSKNVLLTQYWDLKKHLPTEQVNGQKKSLQEWTSSLDELLKKAIKQQMVSDVPLGAFLSGGVDSSVIAALMQAQSSQKIKTFSIGFGDEKFNEAVYAKAVANHLGTDHTELYVSSQDALNVVPQLAKIYDEPFADSSQVPTFLLAKMAREKVTVSLSGDAGDELFSGYSRYLQVNNTWNKLQYLPVKVRENIGKLIVKTDGVKWDAWFERYKRLIPSRFHMSHFGDKMHKGAAVLGNPDEFSFYDGFITHWPSGSIMSNDVQAEMYNFSGAKGLSFVEKMMFLDSITYLPDDILVKVDRAAMANSLETRVPFLDHRVVEFAWRIPMNLKLRDGKSKWLLRQVLYNYVPSNLIERPKMGFGVPLESWLRGPLKDWADELLSEQALNKHGLLKTHQIRSAWQAHLKGERSWHYRLWDVLMFQSWYQEYFG